MSQAMLKNRTRLVVMLSLILLTAFVVRPGGGRVHSAATPDVFTVTNLNDSGEGSLRDAIDQANNNPGPDTIVFQDELTGTILLTSGELAITGDLTITGPGIFSINVSGNHQSRIFDVIGVSVNISGLTISDGSAVNGAGPSSTGGGILNNGTLTLTNVVLSGSSATQGGGIMNTGSLIINNTTLLGNSSSQGSGIYNNGGMATITNSTLSGNFPRLAPSDGGGIFNDMGGTINLINSTVSGNTAYLGGGITNNSASTVNISFTTISNNAALISNGGGGIFNNGNPLLPPNALPIVNIKNSIVANNTSGGDCANSGTFNATGVNFTTNGTCPGFTQVTPAQLHLGPLADNGGPTQTHALLIGSVAIDAANDCTDLSGNPTKPSAPQDVVSTDQRGFGRPQGNACDAGAYEFVPCNQQPVIFCSEDFTVSTDSNQCAAVVDYTAPASDCPCNGGGGAGKPTPKVVKSPTAPKEGATCTVTCAPPAGSTFPRGTTTVSCTATDINGNTAQCSFSITVTDQTPPAVFCPANITKSTDANQCSTTADYTVTANDNCDGPVTATCAPASGSTFQKGTTTVTCVASDSSKNTGSCSFTVTVNDTQPPSLACPANITVTTPPNGAGCSVVTYTTPTASDNCPLPPNVVVCAPPSGSCFARGVTTVTCTATDASNNTASCSFRVTVFDVCLQDDSNPGTVVLVSTATGDYRFCCGGTVFTGRGKVTIRGQVYTLEHNASDRRVLVTDDESTHRGSASLQTPVGVTRCTITDRDTRNNSCACQ